MIVKTRHTGLVVKDISASIAFYEGLGLSVGSVKNEKGDFLSQVVGLKMQKLKLQSLKCLMDHYWSYSNTNLIQQSLLPLNTHLIIMDARMWLLPFRMLKKFLLKLFVWVVP